MQEIIYIIVLSFGSIITLFILTKLMGYRQMSEMSMFDYINGITIGSIAAEMATSLEQSFWQPFTAMVVYGICGILLSHATSKSGTSPGKSCPVFRVLSADYGGTHCPVFPRADL